MRKLSNDIKLTKRWNYRKKPTIKLLPLLLLQILLLLQWVQQMKRGTELIQAIVASKRVAVIVAIIVAVVIVAIALLLLHPPLLIMLQKPEVGRKSLCRVIILCHSILFNSNIIAIDSMPRYSYAILLYCILIYYSVPCYSNLPYLIFYFQSEILLFFSFWFYSVLCCGFHWPSNYWPFIFFPIIGMQDSLIQLQKEEEARKELEQYKLEAEKKYEELKKQVRSVLEK